MKAPPWADHLKALTKATPNTAGLAGKAMKAPPWADQERDLKPMPGNLSPLAGHKELGPGIGHARGLRKHLGGKAVSPFAGKPGPDYGKTLRQARGGAQEAGDYVKDIGAGKISPKDYWRHLKGGIGALFN